MAKSMVLGSAITTPFEGLSNSSEAQDMDQASSGYAHTMDKARAIWNDIQKKWTEFDALMKLLFYSP